MTQSQEFTQPHQITMARASSEEILLLTKFLGELEGMHEQGELESRQSLDWLRENIHQIKGWRRIVFGYEVLLENACDPNLDYLEWKPELKEGKS